MSARLSLSKSDARRALVRHHFAPSRDVAEVFDRLRSIQFDPIAPVGCNHDLVLQARVPGYQIGDWHKITYQDRLVYDGWDKQASLVPFEGWPVRRIYHKWHQSYFDRIFRDHPHAVEAILKELEARGPLMPKDCLFQERKDEWKDTWHGPNLSKQTLRALWHSGKVMTSGRKGGHHVYDLTERIVPPHLFNAPKASDQEVLRELVLERHRAVGLLRPTAAQEVWSFHVYAGPRNAEIRNLVEAGQLVEVDVEGMKAHATPEWLSLLDQPSLEPEVTFIAPLDQFMWDRKMIQHVFDFDYIWEIYTPEAKRRWGYYVLPVRYGDRLVGRVEFFARKGVLEVRRWHTEAEGLPPGFFPAFSRALSDFMNYAKTTEIVVLPEVAAEIREACLA